MLVILQVVHVYSNETYLALKYPYCILCLWNYILYVNAFR